MKALRAILVTLAIASLPGCGPDRSTVERGLLEKADGNRDGSLDLTEFMKFQPQGVSADDSRKAFDEADENKDQKLSFDEFSATLPKPHRLFWFLGVFSAISFVGSLVAIPIVVARLPVTHFIAPHEAADWVASSVGRRSWLVLKNLMGVLLIAGGIMMLVLPGQGVLTILLGVALLDLPGKWRLMRALARREHVMRALNWMRERAEKPPLIAPLRKGDTHLELAILHPERQSPPGGS